MSNLMYNSSTDIKVERSYLPNLQTPEPMGSRHAPYPFHSFVNDTVFAIEDAGFKIEQEDYAITKDENRLFGLLNISRPVAPVSQSFGMPTLHQSKWNLLVGLRGAHDQSVSRGLAIGSQVMVCSNLCFHGNLGNWQSKQTTNISRRIPDLVADAVSGLGNAGAQLRNTPPMAGICGGYLIARLMRLNQRAPIATTVTSSIVLQSCIINY